MKKLEPNFIRATSIVLFWMIILTVITYFWQGYRESKWWDADYMKSLLIPFCIAPVAVWFMFVPKQLSYSETEFTIQSIMQGKQTLPWTELKYYGKGNNVFMIQFGDKQAFQIFASAYPKNQWGDFILFLQSTFPEKRATGYIGSRMFKWGKKP